MRLIINADDFGSTRELNENILFLHKQGIVSSATLMAGAKYLEEAVEISKSNPSLGVGVHLCLDGPLNLGNNYDTIINKATGKFYAYQDAKKKIVKFKFSEQEIFREFCLQIEKVQSYNIRITHLDHHHHLHLYLPVLRSMVKAAKTYKIPYIRPQTQLMRNQKSFLDIAYRNIHHLYLKLVLDTVYGYYTPSIIQNKDFEKEYVRLENLMKYRNKTVEIMLHLFHHDDPEMRFYSDKRVMELLKQQLIINYATIG